MEVGLRTRLGPFTGYRLYLPYRARHEVFKGLTTNLLRPARDYGHFREATSISGMDVDCPPPPRRAGRPTGATTATYILYMNLHPDPEPWFILFEINPTQAVPLDTWAVCLLRPRPFSSRLSLLGKYSLGRVLPELAVTTVRFEDASVQCGVACWSSY